MLEALILNTLDFKIIRPNFNTFINVYIEFADLEEV
jgi:hypothetical protein